MREDGEGSKGAGPKGRKREDHRSEKGSKTHPRSSSSRGSSSDDGGKTRRDSKRRRRSRSRSNSRERGRGGENGQRAEARKSSRERDRGNDSGKGDKERYRGGDGRRGGAGTPAAVAKPAAERKVNVLVDQPATVTGRTGGVYIPPFKLAQMQKDAETMGKATKEYQRIAWEALRKSINGLINKASLCLCLLCRLPRGLTCCAYCCAVRSPDGA